jgi:hypothetical protein
MAEPDASMMPMFYRTPTVLSAMEHAQLAVARKRNYSFCAKVNSIPVVLSEVPRLIGHYPVAFTLGEQPMLMAIVGARNDENLFVDEAGNWEPGRYIPAYVRRFPFVLMEPPDHNSKMAGLPSTRWRCSAFAWNYSRPSNRLKNSVRRSTKKACSSPNVA